MRDDIPETYRVGLFALQGKAHEAWIRFSNAAVLREDDLKANDQGIRQNGSRGMAIKVLDVDGETLSLDNGKSNQDFLMINTPEFAFANVRDYLRLNRILARSSKGDVAMPYFLPAIVRTPGLPVEQRQLLQAAIDNDPLLNGLSPDDLKGTFASAAVAGKIAKLTVRNPMEVQYFGAAPFLFGAGRVMKFSAAPCTATSQAEFDAITAGSPSPNYLREALGRTMGGEQAVCYDFKVQVRGVDAEALNIEDATTTWPDEAVGYVDVGRITVQVPQAPHTPGGAGALREACLQPVARARRSPATRWHQPAAPQGLFRISQASRRWRLLRAAAIDRRPKGKRGDKAMKRALIAAAALAGIAVAGHPHASIAQDCNAGSFEGAFAGEVVVPQNWNCRERQEFWFTDQGSQIIPYVWFLPLEQAAGTAKFSDPVNMDRYRYLPQQPTAMNPDGLPIGFTKGSAKNNRSYSRISRDWLGLTCAACHTGRVEFNSEKYLIDGAPTMGDFETLFRDLVAAMKATLDDEAKFQRFADAVIADSRARGDGGAHDPAQLRDQLEMMTRVRHDWNERNKGNSPYGHARLDAIGAIFNETGVTGLNEGGQAALADAPVSYPFIWDTPQHDKVQWNGSVTNAGPGALGRNVGEVLGVFGALDLNTVLLSRTGHATSVNVASLARLEELMWQLQSPQWRDTGLPEIDQDLADQGRKDFEEFCMKCHRDIDRDDPARRIKARMFPVANPNDPDDPNALATDVTVAANFLTKTAKAHRLTGRFTRYWGVFSGFEVFGPEERDATANAKILGYSVIGAITRLFWENPEDTLRAIEVGQPPEVVAILDQAARHLTGKADKTSIRRFLKEVGGKIKPPNTEPNNRPVCFPDGGLACYKARPLNGIWATAPYLHNGSVRSMRQLLLPASQRETSFKVGTREFDPVDMGFKNHGAFTLDTSLPGNSNAGHDGPIYGNAVLAEDKDRMDALLEYLKTL